MHFYLFLQLTLFLQLIILSQPNFFEAVTFNYNSSGSRPQCVEAERKSLLQIKADLTDPSGRLSSWVGEDCCGWVGVGYSNLTGNVVKLDLHGDYSHTFYSALSGMLSPQLGNLSSLQYLDLSNNWLWASDLNWLSSLTSLQYLNLRDNKMNGYIPESLGELSSLTELYLDSNSWKGKLSEVHFKKLHKLNIFFVSSCEELVFDVARDWIPPFSLESIYIDGCQLGPAFILMVVN